MAATVLDKCVPETLAPELNANSVQPPLFDGTTKLYVCYTCPFAQRVWITRNYKGLQDQIKLVPINLQSKPAWYAEKVYSPGKVPCLEHNGKVVGESLELIKYIEKNFEGPSLFPQDPSKKALAGDLYSFVDSFAASVYGSLGGGDVAAKAGPGLDYLESCLGKFDDGPFFLGQFSLADIAFIPLIERFQLLLAEFAKYDIIAGRPKLATWIEEMNKIQAYKQTKADPNVLMAYFRKRFAGQ